MSKHKQNIFPNTYQAYLKKLKRINAHSKYLEKGDVNNHNHKFPPPQHELTDKSNIPREAGLKAEQPIISRSHSKPVSCLRGRGEEAATASALPDTERPEKPRSDCCKAFVQNCVKTAEKVWVLNPLIGKSVGVKTPTSPTGATPLPAANQKPLFLYSAGPQRSRANHKWVWFDLANKWTPIDGKYIQHVCLWVCEMYRK